MVDYPNKKPFALRGRNSFRVQNLAWMLWSMMSVAIKRSRHGPTIPGCSWQTEVGIHFLRDQFARAARLQPVADGRDYLDSILFHSPVLEEVEIELVDGTVQGTWFTPPQLAGTQPVLFFPGGGYIFSPASTATLHAAIALVTGRRIFVASYPLAPEHPFPAQLNAAQRAYLWMVEELGIAPQSMILGGASAGGNLCLALLLSLRDQARPMPALACLLSPWVDLANSGESMARNDGTDWILLDTCMLTAGLYSGTESVTNPLISPLYADLHGLSPLYIQAGGREIFIDMIRAFYAKAEGHRLDVRLDVWGNMIHCFQAFYEDFPDSKDALTRLGEVINQALGESQVDDHQLATQDRQRLFV